MALNLADLGSKVQEDQLDKRAGGAGRAPTVPDEDNPFLGDNGWLVATYGDENSAKSVTVPNDEARSLYVLIQRSAAKVGVGVAVQTKDGKGHRVDYVNVTPDAETKTFAWVNAETGRKYNGDIKVVWKAKDRKQRRTTESDVAE
jgi:hypothetical protein